MRKIYVPLFCLFLCSVAGAQSTYMQVYNILQSNCTSGCHNNSNPCNLILTGDSATVYNLLVNQAPVNATALAAGNKLVDPGNPRNSFLFLKINQGLDTYIGLRAGEGMTMPDSNVSMTKTQREMVRQWINFAAQDTGTFTSMSLIDNFYNSPTDTGEHSIAPLAPPDSSLGYQLHFGPIFMASGAEFEYNSKYFLQNQGTIDVNRMQVFENLETHHFAIYNFFPGADTLVPKGLNRVTGISDEAILYYNALVVAQWPKPMDVSYPNGTALVWTDSSILCLDYHLINYETYTIAAEVYLNVYYQAHNPATISLQTYPVRYGGDNVQSLVIPPGDSTFTIVQGGPGYQDSTFYWNIVSMQAHTHKYGVGFDVWTRKANGEKDSMVYNGDFNPAYTQDLGVYVWNDPPYRRYDPILPVWMANGLIHEASYSNTSSDTVVFGLTTSNEMFVTFILYYESEFPATEVGDVMVNDNVKMFPNPAFDNEYIKIDPSVALNQTEMVFYNTMGQKVIDIQNVTSHLFTANMANLADGCYVYQLINGGNNIGTGKIMVQH